MRTIVRYVDGKAEWSDNVPSRARLPWTQAGSISGQYAAPVRAIHIVDRTAAAHKGWATKRLRGQGLEPS